VIRRKGYCCVVGERMLLCLGGDDATVVRRRGSCYVEEERMLMLMF
jgi:ribosomal protein L36